MGYSQGRARRRPDEHPRSRGGKEIELSSMLTCQYGGPGLGMVECAIISENLGFGCTGVQTAIEGLSRQ